MKEVQIQDKIFLIDKLDVFDQQFVLGKFSKVFLEVQNVLHNKGSEQDAFVALQEGFAGLGRAVYKEVTTLLLSKVKYKQKVSDGVSSIPVDIMTVNGGFQFDWVEKDFGLFQTLVSQAFNANFEDFLSTKGN